MKVQALFDILEPSYGPCPNFVGACSGACIWDPSRDIPPCAFGGATGSPDEVRLLIVTAEPGDPPDDAGYEGAPEKMVRNSLRIFHEAMEKGGIERTGRPTPFHRNMRRILDAFWPDEPLEAQLRKTWATNAVLCPAKTSGGEHPKIVERTCAATYLIKTTRLVPVGFRPRTWGQGSQSQARSSGAEVRCSRCASERKEFRHSQGEVVGCSRMSVPQPVFCGRPTHDSPAISKPHRSKDCLQ